MPSSDPPSWIVTRLHYSDRKPRDYSESKQPRDRAVINADAITVRITDSRGVHHYRVIHGAASYKQIGDLVDKVTRIVSPV